MNAAIIGSTGLVGQALLKALLASGQYQRIWLVGRRSPEISDSGDTTVTVSQCELNDIGELGPPFHIDHCYSSLGTTIKQAGSQAQFIAVDKTAVLAFVQLCKAKVNLVITALGANPDSRVFYNRIKGETEQALASYCRQHQCKLVLFQPSLLLGARPHSRKLEDLGQTIMPHLRAVMVGKLRQYQPIEADIVAKSMLLHSQLLLNKPISTVSNLDMPALRGS